MAYFKVVWRKLTEGELVSPGDISVYDNEDPNHPENTGEKDEKGSPYSLVMRPVTRGYWGLRFGMQCSSIPRQEHIWRPVKVIEVEDSAGL